MASVPRPKLYRGPIVTTDAVVMGIADDHSLQVLTITRARDPFVGARALPGVYVNEGETISAATTRCLDTKAGLTIPRGTFGHVLGVQDRVGRDPRGHAISIVTLSVVPTLVAALRGQWLPMSGARRLAFDHDDIVTSARAWLQRNLWSDLGLAMALVGPHALTTATLVARQQAVSDEAEVDVSNLRRRLIASGLVQPTDATHAPTGRGRPSAVWQWLQRPNPKGLPP